MIILEELDHNVNISSNLFTDTTYFTSYTEAYGVCMFAIASDILGIMLSVLLCTIIIIRKLWSDPLFIFILCYFVSEIIHSFAYMFSIITDCFLTIAINELVCRSVEIMILFSGMTAGIWLCLNGIVRMIYFVYPFKYVTICKMRHCVIAILASVITILLYTLIMGGFPYRLPAFTNDCRKAEKSIVISVD